MLLLIQFAVQGKLNRHTGTLGRRRLNIPLVERPRAVLSPWRRRMRRRRGVAEGAPKTAGSAAAAGASTETETERATAGGGRQAAGVRGEERRRRGGAEEGGEEQRESSAGRGGAGAGTLIFRWLWVGLLTVTWDGMLREGERIGDVARLLVSTSRSKGEKMIGALLLRTEIIEKPTIRRSNNEHITRLIINRIT